MFKSSEYLYNIYQCSRHSPDISRPYLSCIAIHKVFCIEESLMCSQCGFTTMPIKLYNEARFPNTSRGKCSGDLNIRLAIALTKTGVCVSAIREILATLDLPVISSNTLQKCLDRIGALCTSVNKSVMAENRQNVHMTKELRGDIQGNVPAPVRVMTDTSYNNCHKDRGFFQSLRPLCQLLKTKHQKI